MKLLLVCIVIGLLGLGANADDHTDVPNTVRPINSGRPKASIELIKNTERLAEALSASLNEIVKALEVGGHSEVKKQGLSRAKEINASKWTECEKREAIANLKITFLLGEIRKVSSDKGYSNLIDHLEALGQYAPDQLEETQSSKIQPFNQPPQSPIPPQFDRVDESDPRIKSQNEAIKRLKELQEGVALPPAKTLKNKK